MRVIWLLLVSFLQVHAESLECDDSRATIGQCLRPLLDVWEAIRESEYSVQKLLFPIPFYSKKAIHRLCVSYISATDNCSEELFTNRCAPNTLMLFVDSHLKFFCGEYGPAYLENYECISKSLSRSSQCRNHILGVPNPVQSSGFTALSLASNLDFFRRLQKRLPHQYERSYFDATREQCKGMTEFFECIQGDLTDQCGQTAAVLLEKSIEGLGCLNGTSGSEGFLLQLNTTGLLTDQHRRNYFKGAQKMELEVDLTALEPVRDNDDYPKMPEIAFDKDVSNDSIVTKKEETFNVSTATDLIADDTTESSSSQSEHRLLPRKVEVVTELSVEAVADGSSVAYNASSIVFGDDDSVSTTQEPELETTEFIITTTTHPPYCIPYRDHPTISRCHKGIMAKLSAITDESPESASVRFPLYNVSIDTLVELCDDFRDAKKCMEGVENYCRHPLLEFFNQQFTSTCTLLKMRDFDVDYVCIQKKITMRDDCLLHINGTTHLENKCTGHEDFLSCMRADLEQVCGEESYNSVVTMIRGYGCNVSDDIEAANFTTTASTTRLHVSSTMATTQRVAQNTTVTLPTTTTVIPTTQSSSKTDAIDMEASGEAPNTDAPTNVFEAPQAKEASSEPHIVVLTNRNGNEGRPTKPAETVEHKNDIDEEFPPLSSERFSSEEDDEETMEDVGNDDPLFNYTISSNCTEAMRVEARICTVPLMRTWAALRETWPHLKEVTFPIYKYSRVELLELCDSYANVFLCANMDNIRECIKDELVRFAQDHLGYICSPQNIQRFMNHYDCIMEQEAMGRGNCRRHIMGEAVPGKDEHKCRGVKAYRACLAPHLTKHCRPGALKEFDASVRQFGCFQHGLTDVEA